MTLEDESGRIRLVGDVLKSVVLVTGCIIAVMGSENVNGELEVIDLKFPDLAPQPDRWALMKQPSAKAASKMKDEDIDMNGTGLTPCSNNSKIAIVSGLAFSGTDASHSLELNLLLEYLLGETLDPVSQQEISQISRLIIAGNSISVDERRHADEEQAQRTDSSGKKAGQKKYGYDSSTYNAQPSQQLDEFLSTLLPTIPVTMMPGAQDPSNASYPQQPVHSAMFPASRAYAAAPSASLATDEPGWFDSVTNPWEGEIDGWRVLGTGGQNVDDVWKYVDSDDRLGMMEAMCRWRCSAPTAPDTLCKSRRGGYPLVSLKPSFAPLSPCADTISNHRGVPVPRRRPVCDAHLPAPVLRRQPAAVWHKGHHWPRGPVGAAHCRAVFLGHRRDRARGHRDPGCQKGAYPGIVRRGGGTIERLTGEGQNRIVTRS